MASKTIYADVSQFYFWVIPPLGSTGVEQFSFCNWGRTGSGIFLVNMLTKFYWRERPSGAHCWCVHHTLSN